MDNLIFKMGKNKENLMNVPIQNGAIYLVQALNELYVDMKNQRYKITDTAGLHFDIIESISFQPSPSFGYFTLNQSKLNETDVLQ